MSDSSSLNISNVVGQVMWNRLISIVEEQAQTLIRTAFSTSVREAGDLSAGVYDIGGRMLAQAVTGTPGHVNSMADSVAHFMREIGEENMYEGDVYITNDPWKGTGHLHDITVVTPSFYRGRHIGYFGCTAHVVDIGGRGLGVDGRSVYEEGFRIPIMKFAERGAVDESFVKILRHNVREENQVVGDVYALATCNEIGQRRLADMLDEFDDRSLEAVGALILEQSYRATVERLQKLPSVQSSHAMRIDGFTTPIDLVVSLSFKESHIDVDFSGTSGADIKGINVPLVYTKAYACYALKCALAPDIPNNAGALAPFRVTAPRGCILHAIDPSPVALRHVIGHMIPDVIFGALHKTGTVRVPAEGASSLCNFQLSLRSCGDRGISSGEESREVLTFNSGGSGARFSSDGLNSTAFPSGVMTMPVEATEHTGPVIIWRKELRPDSGGAGCYRGGLGQYMEVGAWEGYEFDLSAMFERVFHPARGRDGGGYGAPTCVTLDDGTVLSGKGRHLIPAGRRVCMAFPGGGGYGNPRDRDKALIARDIMRGYISLARAQELYGFTEEEDKE